jgi:hypothetical protein
MNVHRPLTYSLRMTVCGLNLSNEVYGLKHYFFGGNFLSISATPSWIL